MSGTLFEWGFPRQEIAIFIYTSTLLYLDKKMNSSKIAVISLCVTVFVGMGLIFVQAQGDWGYDPYTGEPLTNLELTDGERLILHELSSQQSLIFGAIGASLVASLASIVSLMQISRRIAG